MREDFLHYVWRFSYFNISNLTDTRGNSVKIINPGILNRNAGPDFHDARIEIDGVLWTGSVEIHINASDWYRHNHQTDPAYENVILHVVWQNDKPVSHPDGTEIPALELSGRISQDLLSKNDGLNACDKGIPCANSLTDIPEVKRRAWMDRALANRLERKGADILKLYKSSQSWEDTARTWLFRNLGHKVNAEPFERLAKAVPGKAIAKQSDSGETLEALLFGTAGFLSADPADDYHRRLSGHYQLLARKYNLEERRLKESDWKFSRLRPANYPTLRISQLATLFTREPSVFNFLTEGKNLQVYENQFNLRASDYWRRHHAFGKTSSRSYAKMGQNTGQYLVTNAVVPFLHTYGQATGRYEMCDKAVALLEELPPESNTILEKWKATGTDALNAFDSQALIERYNEYCVPKKCPRCLIGHEILRS
ncbi:hypothetical protein FUAX_11210 [Fulvitalea axinellae]|uniref:DUF2851 family protein n=1 Tax=Fulvitalea axinellae TaxID=1182444 RepID=A0AAU9D2T3_9BACT|nr:hypothetical protein FUAX_11210 [Fulvitalea axinellae]